MPDEKTCRDYLAKQRWDGKVACPYCKHQKCYSIEKGKRWKCADSKCYKRFTVTVGTIFEASNIPLNKWFPAIYLCTAHKRGISSYQLARNIGVTQKTSWFMMHRIREVLRNKDAVILGYNGAVEADETFVGGKYANMHTAKRNKLLEECNGGGYANKTTVLGMIERGGDLVAKVIANKSPGELTRTISATVNKNATLITDSTNLYSSITHAYNHHAVNHSINEYVRGDAHTNTVEGVFSHFKRSIYGTFFHISAKHTQRYCDEFALKFNTRRMNDADRFAVTLKRTECRLKYKYLISATAPEVIIVPAVTENRGQGFLQLKDGEILGHFHSLKEAHELTGVEKNNLKKVLQGKRKTANGFNWIYA